MKLLDDGIGQDTFGEEDRSEPDNKYQIVTGWQGLSCLTGRSILVPHEDFVFGFEVGDSHEIVLIEPANVHVLEVITHLLDGGKLEVGCRARRDKGACLLVLPLTCLMQTFSGGLIGKISVILILGL